MSVLLCDARARGTALTVGAWSWLVCLHILPHAGASTLAIAFACRELGLILFLVLLVLFGALANFSIQLLTRSLTFSDRETYGDIGYEAMGRFGEMLALCWYVPLGTVELDGWLWCGAGNTTFPHAHVPVLA